MTAPRRIVMHTTSPYGTVGGMETVFGHLARSLRAAGHEVTTLHDGPRVEPVGEGAWAVPLEVLRTWRRLPRPGSVWRTARSYAALRRLLRRLRPDVVHVHFVGGEAAYFLALRRALGFRVVLTGHGSDLRRHYHAVSRFVQPRVLRAADVVTVVSDPLADRVRELSGREAVVIPNGVDLGVWGALPRAPERGRVVVVGRLVPVKGHDVLLDALPAVRARVSEVRLVVVGEGGEGPALRQRAERLGVADAVEWAGALAPEGVREQFARAAAFVLPSRGEGMPMALLEAMAAGVPAVASAVGAVPELLADGAGRTVPPEDVGALSGALADLLSDAGAAGAASEAARRRVRAWSWSRTVAAYEAVLADRPPPHLPQPERPLAQNLAGA
jgi:glycosyltransferase involved in cell wall biosynthesis